MGQLPPCLRLGTLYHAFKPEFVFYTLQVAPKGWSTVQCFKKSAGGTTLHIAGCWILQTRTLMGHSSITYIYRSSRIFQEIWYADWHWKVPTRPLEWLINVGAVEAVTFPLFYRGIQNDVEIRLFLIDSAFMMHLEKQDEALLQSCYYYLCSPQGHLVVIDKNPCWIKTRH